MLTTPENRMDAEANVSYAIALPKRVAGDAAGCCWVHVVPFQVQVSLMGVRLDLLEQVAVVSPPNTTTVRLAPS
jgi:hypothetical protein